MVVATAIWRMRERLEIADLYAESSQVTASQVTPALTCLDKIGGEKKATAGRLNEIITCDDEYSRRLKLKQV